LIGNSTKPLLLGVAILIGCLWFSWWAIQSVWTAISSTQNPASVAIVAGFFSIIGATFTVTLGRHFDRRKEIEAAFREKKIAIYDEFLTELFKIFQQPQDASDDPDETDLVSFLQEWQKTLVLWGGKGVLKAYFAWMSHLKAGIANAKSIFLMDEFFRAMRKDIGQSSAGLQKGAFSHLILRRADLFLSEAAKKPNVTLEEIGKLEDNLEDSK
jgi:hypothetical protein